MKKCYATACLFGMLWVSQSTQAKVHHLPDHKEWNTFYYLQDESFRFSVDNNSNRAIVNGNAPIILDTNSSFSTTLQPGINEIKSSMYTFIYPGFPGNGESITGTYRVKASLLSFEYNKSNGVYAPGEEVVISFTGLELPLPLSDTHVPQSAKLVYTTNFENLPSVESEEAVSSAEALNTLRFKIPEAIGSGAYKLSSGIIREYWNGSPLYSGQLQEAGKYGYDFDVLPEIGVVVEANTVPEGPFGYESNEVAKDWKNDLWLNADYQEMTPGGTYKIVARRVPEIIDNPISNSVTLPPFRYSIVRGNSVSIDASGLVTAKKEGVSIIEVTYSSIVVNGNTYAALSPVNTTYMVVNVLAEAAVSNITISSTIDTNSYNTYYYTGDQYEYTFDVTAAGADAVTVRCNDVDAVKNGNSYTVQLKNRANIVEIIASNGEDEKRAYHVIDARKINVVTTNITNPGQPFTKGDKVQVSFEGIVPPLYKLATYYNPMYASVWGGEYTRVVYQNDQLGKVRSNVNVTQYDLADHNAIEFTLTDYGTYTFNGGHIHSYWWGSELGTEKKYDGPGNANTNAVERNAQFSVLPSFSIRAIEPMPEYPNQIVSDLTKPANPESFVFENGHWVETYNDKEYSFIDMQVFSFCHLPSQNSWGGYSWDGFTVCNSTDNSTDHTDFPNRQWGCMAQGGVDSIGAPYLLGFYSEFIGKTSNQVIFSGDGIYQPNGMYVSSTPYVNKCIQEGFFVARPFAQDDYMTLTAHGLNEEYEDNGKSATFYLADYRSSEPTEWKLNKGWEWMDLRTLGNCAGIYFTLETTDKGQFGSNTASYFAMDKLSVSPVTANGLMSVDKTDLQVYPNPFSDILIIEASVAGEMQLFDLQGKEIMRQSIHSGVNQIATSHIPAGVYIVRSGERSIRLIK